jgi:hypothetical protein
MIRHLILTTVLILYCVPGIGQDKSETEPDNLKAILEVLRSDVNSYKIRVLNQVMELTGPEADEFWPIYREYENELAAVGDRKVTLLRDYATMRDKDAMDQQAWDELSKKWLENVQDRLDLWKEYQKKISKAVSPMRAAQFLQVENQMALFIDLNIASEMPAVGDSPEEAE